MNDWNRDRDDDRQRMAADDRYGRDDRRSDWRGDAGWRARESRSFDATDCGRRDRDWDERDDAPTRGARDSHRSGYGRASGYDSAGRRSEPRYGEALYTPMDPGTSAQAYRSRSSTLDHDMRAQRYDGRADGRDRDRSGRGGIVGENEPLQRVTDGDDDTGFRMFGEHRGRGPKNYVRSDDRIRDDVNDRLSDDSWLDASDIDVQVSSCEVTLAGTVASRDDKRRAEDIAEAVSGVRHVQNNLRVQAAASSTTSQPMADRSATSRLS